jgi:Flp pilus assembly protein TadG
MLLPFLLLLVLGIVEFGYFLGEFNDVRHGAREGARLAAVNAGDNNFLETETCDRMDLTAVVTVQFTDGAASGGSAAEKIGSIGTVEVAATPTSLSGVGFIEVFLPSTLTSTIDFRLEQESTNWGDSAGPISC